MSLNLYQRVTQSEAHLPLNLDHIARNYRRISRAVGGWYSGGFYVSPQDVGQQQLQDFYNSWIGYVVKESAYGMPAWEGLVYQMQLTLDGAVYEISLDPERWHNNVDVYYSDLAIEDVEQGNLSYTTEGADETFTDDAQNFVPWETAAGDAAYRIQIANTNNTETWGYLGEAVGATEIRVYTTAARATSGWNGQAPAGLTPRNYEVVNVANYGVREHPGWSRNEDSLTDYGQMQYIITLPGAQATPATALRDRSLTEYAWPRSRFVGTSEGADSLAVTLAGFWGTTFWRYRETSRTAEASTLIAAMVDNSTEFVTAGRIDENTLELTADGFPIPQRVGDLLMRIQEMGDAAGNVWKMGVYENRDLVYEQAPTTAEYLWRDGRLLNKAGQPVQPELVRPGFYLRAQNILGAVQPPGTSAIWDDPDIAYVDEVEWALADHTLTLSLRNSGPSLVLRQQILGGAA